MHEFHLSQTRDIVQNMSKEQQQQNTYTGASVQEGLDGVRHQLGMYLGSTGLVNDRHAPRALTQMAQEVLSNARDEIVAGYGDRIDVVIHRDGAMTIKDRGRGIPKGPGDSFREVVKMLTKTHASGKFDSSSYANEGVAGLHGIGLKAVNAASSYVTIEAIAHSSAETSDGNIDLTGERERYVITFNQEEVVAQEHEPNIGDDIPTGTTITFKPDDGIISEKKPRPLFESVVWTNNDLEPMLEATAFLMPGTHVTFRDERPEDQPIELEWKYDNGLSDYVTTLVEGQTLVQSMKEPIAIADSTEVNGHKITVNAALAFTSDTSGAIFSYANGVPTREGGPHLDGFMNAVVSTVNEVAPKILNKKVQKLIEADVTPGFTAAFEVKVPGEITSFEGQIKEKLGTTEAQKATLEVVKTGLTNWMLDNRKAATEIINSVLQAATTRTQMAKSRQEQRAAKKTKKGGKLVVSSKLRAATSRNPQERELYIVEGDSASEIGRDPKTQAVFPIRGKIPNVRKLKSLREALQNNEISTLISTLGAGAGPEFNVDDVQYGKIIIATDADSDGSHIRMLLFTLLYTYMPGLIQSGKVYVLEPPLYRAERYANGKRDLVVAYTDEEMRKMMPKLKGYDISRYKGLGMMESDEAHRYIANREHRRILQLTVDDVAALNRRVNIFMGNDAAQRAQWIESQVQMV